jgi:hypothetical protein
MREHEGTANLRYLAPPAALVAVASGAVVGTFWRPALVAPVGYAAAVLVGSAVVGRGLSARPRALLPAVIVTMHMSWGYGFLTSPRALRHRSRA